VWGWELRRVAARRLSWVLALAAFLFFAGMIQFKHAWSLGTEQGFAFAVYGTSAVGVLYEFVNVLMFVFALMLPFVVTEGVAADYKRRVHELLMAAPLPGWAYVWGRFLAAATLGLGMSVLMLLAYLLMAFVLHQRSALYPLPAPGEVLAVWLVLAVPATLLIAGLGFSLGTLWPRRARVMTLALLITWMLLFTLGNVLGVNPTGNVMVVALVPGLMSSVQTQIAGASPAQQALIIQQVQAVAPDLGRYLLAQYSLAALGLLLVAVTAAVFRRFQQLLE
jgi:ABC-type transport system involved in multi-copper enzyme maturation permease subunit